MKFVLGTGYEGAVVPSCIVDLEEQARDICLELNRRMFGDKGFYSVLESEGPYTNDYFCEMGGYDYYQITDYGDTTPTDKIIEELSDGIEPFEE